MELLIALMIGVGAAHFSPPASADEIIASIPCANGQLKRCDGNSEND